jgi:hypothetical protein
MGKIVGALKRRKVIILLAMVTVALLALTYYQYIATEHVEGRVDHKSIMGDMNDISYTLVMCTPYGLNVNPELRYLVPDNVTDLTQHWNRSSSKS